MKKNEIRELTVLKNLVAEYIQTNEAVSSRVLCDKYLPQVSPATLRIDMMKLEQKGFIYQPHTSAGRKPTIQGLRKYISMLHNFIDTEGFDVSVLREMLIKNYKDSPTSLHYIKQLLAKETDQLSFVAEPEISYGYLSKLDVFRIGQRKLLFVVSLDSGLDKTVIMPIDFDISESQLRAMVRYLNEEIAGQRIFDIQHRYLSEITQKWDKQNTILNRFLTELHNALFEINDFFVHFEGNIEFLEQEEFNSKQLILTFLNMMQRQDMLIRLMQDHIGNKDFAMIMGEDFGITEWSPFTIVFARYELFDIPGFLGIIGPVRMNYEKNIPIIRDVSRTITLTTQKGMMVPNHDKK